MLQRVMIYGIELPRLYIAENMDDVMLAQQSGIPYIRWRQGQDALVRMLLRPTLERMFPHIMWNKVLGRRRGFASDVEVSVSDGTAGIIDAGHAYEHDISYESDGMLMENVDVSENERLFRSAGRLETDMVRRLDIEEYVGDMSSYVNIEILQRLKLMPAFIGDILECVKSNLGSTAFWSEGYNKRRALPVGRYDSRRQLRNLIILDVSGSIPRGISATMISLIDTMRTQLSADLIITSTISKFYPMGEQLPTPQELRDTFGLGNESYDFFNILTHNISGHHYGHVISFGDNDTPDYAYGIMKEDLRLENTTVEHVHHYHTGKYVYDDGKTGYAKWCHLLSRQPEASYDTSWCNVIYKKNKEYPWQEGRR